jgi:hypothetical protein
MDKISEYYYFSNDLEWEPFEFEFDPFKSNSVFTISLDGRSLSSLLNDQ